MPGMDTVKKIGEREEEKGAQGSRDCTKEVKCKCGGMRKEGKPQSTATETHDTT